MSQNIFDTTSIVGAVRVRAGWDSPLQELFCNVESLECELPIDGSAPECFYSTTYSDVDAMVNSLSTANIRLPPEMIDVIRVDWQEQVENVVRVFNADGSFQR